MIFFVGWDCHGSGEMVFFFARFTVSGVWELEVFVVGDDEPMNDGEIRLLVGWESMVVGMWDTIL